MKTMRILLPALVLLLAGGLFLLRHGDEPIDIADAALAGRTTPAASAAVASAATERAVVPATDLPPDVPVEEWQRIKAVMEATPEGRRDLARVGEYLGYRHRMAKWQQGQAGGADAASRAALAQQLLDDMGTRVARREMTAGEAQQLATALLRERISDPLALQQAVKAQLEKVRAALPVPDPGLQAQQQAALAAYQREEAAIAAQWQALPVAQRDQQWLDTRLDAARRATLGMVTP